MSALIDWMKATAVSVARRLKQCFERTEPVLHEEHRFYKLSSSCQIPKLDVIYESLFGRRTDGCFVEVGAFDGEYVSNTSGLADIGWTGYYIEPIPEYCERCKVRHAGNKNVIVSQCAIGAESGEAEINVGGPLSTIRDDVKENFESLDWAKGNFPGEKIQVQQLTLEEYLVKHRVKSEFELLVVDVEGYEWNVFRNFDIQRWRPRMVVIELHDQNDDYLLLREELNALVRYFDDNGYKIIYKDSTNTIYVPKDSYSQSGHDA